MCRSGDASRVESTTDRDLVGRLELAYEELETTTEELRLQNDELVAMQEALQTERWRYQDLFDSAPDAYVVTDLAGTIQEANVAAGLLLGVDRAALHGVSLPGYIADEDRPVLFEQVRRLGAGLQAQAAWEARFRLAPGRELYAALRVAAARRGPDEVEPLNLRWLIRDVTEQVLARRQIAAVAARDQAILDSMTEGLIIFDLQGNILEMNPAALRLHSFTRLEEAQTSFHAYATAVDRFGLDGQPLPLRELPLARVLRGESLRNYRVRLVDPQTGRSWIGSYGGTLVRDDQGRNLLGILTIRDVTEEHEAEAERERLLEENRVQRQFLERIIQAVPLGVVVVRGPDHRIELTNRQYRSLMELPDEPLSGRTLAEVFPRAQAAGRLESYDEILRTGQAVHVAEYSPTLGTPRADSFWDVDMVPLTGARGQVEGILTLVHDVTAPVRARARIEELAAASQHQAEEMDAVFEAMIEGVVVYDVEGHPVRANRAARTAYGDALQGRDRAEIVRRLNLRHPDGRGIAMEESPVDRAMRGQMAVDVPLLFTNAQGEDRSMVASAAPLAGGGAVVVWHDVTGQVRDRQRIEELARAALQQAREMEAVFDAMDEAVVIYDTGGRPVRANRAAVIQTGVDPTAEQDRTGLAARIGLAGEDGQPVAPDRLPSGRALRGEIVRNERYTITHASGQELAVLVSASPLRVQDHVVGAVLVSHDVTDETRAESERAAALEALRDSEAKLRALFEIVPVGISVLDGQRNMTAQNPALAAILHLSETGLHGGQWRARRYVRPDGSPMPPDELPSWRASVEQQPVRSVEIGVVKEDEQTVWVNVSAAPLPFDDWRTIVATVDVTEHVAIKEALARQNEELQALTRELDAFAHTVAHDLKQPLAAILGSADLLSEELQDILSPGALPDLPARLLDTMVHNTQKMHEIVESLLLLASARSQEVEIEAVDMGIILGGVLRSLEPLLHERGTALHLPDVWPPALGYAPWVERVWANYVSNALKYGGQPSRVELGSCCPGEAPGRAGGEAPRAPVVRACARLRAGPQKAHLLFWVWDNGEGLTDEEQARLFRPFGRLARHRKQGHGLGLAIVQRIVERLGGTTGVDSRPGEGTAFWFTLPGGTTTKPSVETPG